MCRPWKLLAKSEELCNCRLQTAHRMQGYTAICMQSSAGGMETVTEVTCPDSYFELFLHEYRIFFIKIWCLQQQPPSMRLLLSYFYLSYHTNVIQKINDV